MKAWSMAVMVAVSLPLGAGWRAESAAPDPGDTVLAAQLDSVRQATARFEDIHQAERAGYRKGRLGFDLPLMGEHWVNRRFLNGPFDLLHPAVLQYVVMGDRRVLVGVAYGRWQRPGDSLPEGFAGNSDQWHVHDIPELIRHLTRTRSWLVRRATSVGLGNGRWTGPDGRTDLAMVHVWLWSDNPEGVFANYNPALPYLRAGLPPAWARSGDYDAARGMTLLVPGGCAAITGRLSRLTSDRADRTAAWRSTCAEAAVTLSAAQRQGIQGDELNAVAAGAWDGLMGTVVASLSAAERENLRQLRESGMEMKGTEHHSGGM